MTAECETHESGQRSEAARAPELSPLSVGGLFAASARCTRVGALDGHPCGERAQLPGDRVGVRAVGNAHRRVASILENVRYVGGGIVVCAMNDQAGGHGQAVFARGWVSETRCAVLG